MAVRSQDYPPLLAWYGHVENCDQCAKTVLYGESEERDYCDPGRVLRNKAREKTRWSSDAGRKRKSEWEGLDW